MEWHSDISSVLSSFVSSLPLLFLELLILQKIFRFLRQHIFLWIARHIIDYKVSLRFALKFVFSQRNLLWCYHKCHVSCKEHEHVSSVEHETHVFLFLLAHPSHTKKSKNRTFYAWENWGKLKKRHFMCRNSASVYRTLVLVNVLYKLTNRAWDFYGKVVTALEYIFSLWFFLSTDVTRSICHI